MKIHIVIALLFAITVLSCKKVTIEHKMHNCTSVYETGITNDLEYMSFCDKNNNGLVIANPSAGNGIILKTADGGKSWDKIICPVFGRISGVTLFKSKVAYLFCDTFLLRSMDGGVNWSTQKTGGVNSIQFTSELTGYGIYNTHKLMKTTNGGLSWSVVYDSSIGDFDYRFRYLSCPDDQTIFANAWPSSGWVSLYLKSVDGGATWSKLPAFSSEYTEKMYFCSPNSGFVYAGTVLKTTDGGLSWKSLSSSINEIYMADENIGFGLSGQFNFTLTKNGGDTWREPFIEERSKDGMDLLLQIKKITGFSDRTVYLACHGGKFGVVNAYNLGE
jgi:photosystem II stability/assembly factor-like uncharacterized protein